MTTSNSNISFKLFLLVLAFFFMIYSSSALTIQQGAVTDIKHPVRVNGAIATGVTCNITIVYPNNSLLVNFKQMTDQTSFFNYTLNENQTSLKGQYNYCITCASTSGLNNTECFDMLINLGGVEPSQQRTDVTKLMIYIFLAMSGLFFIVFLYSQQLVIKWSMFLFAAIFLLAALNFLFISVQDEILNPVVEVFLSGLTSASYYVYLFLGVLLGFLWLISLIMTILSRKEIKKEKKYGLG